MLSLHPSPRKYLRGRGPKLPSGPQSICGLDKKARKTHFSPETKVGQLSGAFIYFIFFYQQQPRENFPRESQKS